MTGRLGWGCLVGCAGTLVSLIILCGAVGILAGSCAIAAVPAQSPAPIGDIPPTYLVLYEQASERFGLQWQVLAGIGRVETEHGRLDADCSPNYEAERFIQTLINEWAYARLYESNEDRLAALPGFIEFYNRARPHTALGGRSPIDVVNNVSGDHI